MSDAEFRSLRPWIAAWLLIWIPSYWRSYGAWNFLQLCDVTVLLTCLGLWRRSPLLLSSQAVSSLVVDLAWDVDLAVRALSGRHLVGGTEYMWDARYPLAVRALSLFHLVWPPLLLWALRRTGYDRRGFALQAAIALAVVPLSRLAGANLNFSQRDPFLGRAFGPPPVHVGLVCVALIGAVYWPTHLLLRRLLKPALTAPAGA